MKRIPVDLLDSLLRFTAGGDARRTLSVDSARYTFNRYVLVEDYLSDNSRPAIQSK